MDALPLVAVTVHPDGAVVTRRGTIALTEGAGLVRGLPLLLDPSTLRVRCPGLQQVGLHLDVHGVDRADEPAARAALREAEDVLHRLEADLALLLAERKRLEGLRPPLPEERERREAPQPERLEQWVRLEEVVTGPWSADLDARTRALSREVDRARQVRDKAAAHHRWSSSAQAWKHWAPTRRLALVLDTEATSAEVEVSYRVPGATWTAAYALHTTEALDRGRLLIRALVAQDTGEDWSEVALTLSSTPAARVVELPELPALRLGAAQPPTTSPWRDLPEGLDGLFPDELAPGARAAADEAEREEAWEQAPPPPPAASPMANMALDEAMPVAMAAQAHQFEASSVSSGMAVRGAAPRRRMEKRRAPAPQAATSSALVADEPEPAAPPGGALEVGDDLLDYASLRLHSWSESGRGTLHRVGLAAEVTEAGLPATASAYLRDLMRTLRRKAGLVRTIKRPPHHVLPAAVEGLDFLLRADGRVDIPSNGRFCAVALQEEPLELEVRYRTVPRLDPRAFRAVTARLGRSTPLPPGPVDVVLDGALALTSPWRGSPGGGRIDIGLGVEQGLSVVRNVRYEEERAHMLGGRRLHTRVSVEVASSLGKPVAVEVLDRVPVSKEDDIKVEVLSATPTAEAWEGEPDGPVLEGARRQVLELSSGGQAEATLHYTVTLGGQQELVGGDRRG